MASPFIKSASHTQPCVLASRFPTLTASALLCPNESPEYTKRVGTSLQKSQVVAPKAQRQPASKTRKG